MQKAGKLRRNFSSISFLFFLLCAAVGTRMGQLCGRCMQLLRDFVGFVQRVSSDLVESIRECLILISKCFCLKQNSSKTKQLYKPILQPHERVTAQEFLQRIETGKRTCLFLKHYERARRLILWVESSCWLICSGVVLSSLVMMRKGQSYRAFSLCTGLQGLKWCNSWI